MKATDILSNEHRVIEQVLNCLEKLVNIGARDQKLDTAAALTAIDFFRNFADRCHHDKEEVYLFPMMEKKGFSRESGPTGVMLYEHEQGRSYIRAMREAIDAIEKGDQSALQVFLHHAQSYIDLLRQHIHKEDHCLFSMADNAMNTDDQTYLLSMFDQVENEKVGENTHEKYIEIANQLADRYQVDRAKNNPETSSCSCHHA